MPTEKLTTLFCLLMLLLSSAVTAEDGQDVRLKVERLPDLNIPRAGHAVFYVNGELTVAGGHTDGFVPTPTAEFLKDGKWHTMQMTYTHDFGISVVLKSGKVLLAGGCEQSTGIGQTFFTEIYDPLNHSFRGFGNLQRKRVWASALELDSGRVVIAGNWYNTDGIELFNEQLSNHGDYLGKSSFTYIKEVSAQRSTPFIFRTDKDDALIFGTNDPKGNTIHCTFADRLKGDSIHIPLFEKWQPLKISSHHDEASFIGNNTYLFPVQDSTGQVAIAKVCGSDFALLKTATAIPMRFQDDEIEYFSNIIADQEVGRAYLMGFSRNYHVPVGQVRIYVLSIDYSQDKASNGTPIGLQYTDALGDVLPDVVPVLTPKGNLLIAGGFRNNSNYTPSSEVWLIRTGSESEMAASGLNWWMWGILAVVVLTIVALVIYQKRKPVAVMKPTAQQSTSDSEIMQRITHLMEAQQLYLNSELQLSDVAKALGTNRNVISSCINSQQGCSFTQFVNTYRIKHAMELMQRHPDIKILEVWTTSGFSTERNFLRIFKQQTGMTPSEWKQNND